MRGQHHAGTKNASGNTSAVVGVIMMALLILLAVVVFLAVRWKPRPGRAWPPGNPAKPARWGGSVPR